MSSILCKLVRYHFAFEPNILKKNSNAFTSLVQNIKNLSYECNETQKKYIKREENKGPLRFYSDKLLADTIEKSIKAKKFEKTIKVKKPIGVLTNRKKDEIKKWGNSKSSKIHSPLAVLHSNTQTNNLDAQMVNYKSNWRINDYSTPLKPIESSGVKKCSAKSNELSGQPANLNSKATDNQVCKVDNEYVDYKYSMTRRKRPMRAAQYQNLFQAQMEHAFAKGYTNYVTPSRFHHMNASSAMQSQNVHQLCIMINESLMPINKEIREKIAVPQITNTSKLQKKLFNWNHPPPVTKYTLTFTPLYEKPLSERRTRNNLTRRLLHENSEDEILPEPMRRWNEYYTRAAKEKAKQSNSDVDVVKRPMSLQTEKLDALLKLGYKSFADNPEPIKPLERPVIEVERHSRYTHIKNINQAKRNPNQK